MESVDFMVTSKSIMIKENSPTKELPRTGIIADLVRRAQLWLLTTSDQDEGIVTIKAEMIRTGAKSPKDIPRERRLELFRPFFQAEADSQGPVKLVEVGNMVGLESMLDNMGPDVFVDLIQQELLVFGPENDKQEVIAAFEKIALEEGWAQ